MEILLSPIPINDVGRDIGMRGKSTTSSSETVLHTTDFSGLNIQEVGIVLTGRSGANSPCTFRVRRDGVNGEILLEGTTSSQTEVFLASGIFSKGSGKFVWTAYNPGGYQSIIGNKSGIVGGLIVMKSVDEITIPVKTSLSRLKVATLQDYVIINGFNIFGFKTLDLPASNMFFDGIRIKQLYPGAEEMIALGAEGYVLVIR